MRGLEVMVLTPPGSVDPALAIAACRAGVRGVLDLEYVPDLESALAAVRRLERFTAAEFGVKLGRASGPLLPHLTSPRLAWVLLAGGEQVEWEAWIDQLRGRGASILVEATSVAEAEAGVRLAAEGLVLKGHEAAGRVGPATTFVLLQQWQMRREPCSIPVWVQGGIGLNTAAACAVGGATGVVLDSQLLLCRESPVPAGLRRALEACDGSETACLGERLGAGYRLFCRPGMPAAEELRREEQRLLASSESVAERLAGWRQAVSKQVIAGPDAGAWLVGQDAAFARSLAARYHTVAGVIEAIRQRALRQVDAACRLGPLAEGARLALRHGTRYPIVQGPMTRVSDTPAFAEAVAAAGALPFLALALLRKAEVVKLLEETRDRLAGRPWGAGILGFAPPDIRRGQLDALRAVRPPFALIAGGRPDQARELEKDGIPTYVHVPSPGLLRMFLKDGARRFVFEGRECGGHVGPRTSFVLWETMCEELLAHLDAGGKGDELHVLFAGGIHDALSAAIVAALSAALAERGVAAGVLLGTAYLFTQEAVTTGAIVPRFQQEALGCDETVLLETGPGHAIRCVPTPYADTFEQEKQRLLALGRSADEVRGALEALNVGRLRIASKGVDRAAVDSRTDSALVTLPDGEQHARGMYMIGQVAALRDRVISMADLHAEVSTASAARLDALAADQGTESQEPRAKRERPSDIAIIGLSCFFPKAGSLRAYWHNVLNKVDAVTEVPPDRWDWRLYYDPAAKAGDKICSKWGGFLDDVPFDPLAFGMPPNSLRSIEPVQLLVLEAVRQALADAGYSDRPFDRERTAVVLGAGGGAAQVANAYSFRSYLPLLDTVPGLKERAADILEKCADRLPEWTEDTFPGILLNVAAGRVANRFNLGGPNFSVDAACGSSLAALYVGVRELEVGTSDVAIVMGADTVQNPFTYLLFSKTHAFSPRGRCSAFDEAADGIVISEGVGVVVLKRLADAERDGDRVYAVIKGVGASSDGKDKGLTAPRPEGQARALRRAYAKAGVSLAQVGLVEAHGTGTAVGDQTEVRSLAETFREAGAAARTCAVGSVKSMIGHTKCAAGLAGLINATLALHHKTLPPTLVQRPNPKLQLGDSPLFLNAEARPWVQGESPRRAGVSAFGFGGTNYHAVLEEYTGNYLGDAEPALRDWPAELFVWRRPTRTALVEAVRSTWQALVKGARPDLGGLAAALAGALRPDAAEPTLAIVATSLDDLRAKLEAACAMLSRTAATQPAPSPTLDPRGIYFAEQPAPGKIAFLFPGQGSQYPNMLAQLALAFPEVRRAFDEAERVLVGQLERPLGKLIFPPSGFTREEEEAAARALMRTEVAQPAVGAASLGLFALLRRLGIEPDFLAGHSYGDYVALCAAGAMSADELIRISLRRGQVLRAATQRTPGGMAAVEAGREAVEQALAGVEGVTAANFNSPKQTVISGNIKCVEAALSRLEARGIRGQRLPVGCAFHSSLVADGKAPLAEALAACALRRPCLPVLANATARPYPDDPAAIRGLLTEHVTAPVRFQEEVESLYEAGVRTFIEVGPQAVLTRLASQTLEGRPHLTAASDQKGRPGLVQLQHLLGRLLVQGVPVRLERLHERRDLPAVDLDQWDGAGKETLPPSTWLVNGTRARPVNGPEPVVFGQNRGDEAANGTAPARAPRNPARTLTMARDSHNGHSGVTNGHSNGSPPPAPPADDEAARVVLRFQELMAKFLDTQKSVMLSYLQAGGEAPAAEPPAGPVIKPQVEALPKPQAAPVAKPQAEAPAVSGRDRLAAKLLDLVSKRTGYPPEMLGLDMDLEADLGIDSIKRVEILGSLAQDHGGAADAALEKLTRIKTLRGIVEHLTSANGHSGKEQGQATPAPAPFPLSRNGIRRMVLRTVQVPHPQARLPRLPPGLVLITDDGRGVAEALGRRLREHGRETRMLRADLTEPGAVDALLRHLRDEGGDVAGLVHLLPLAGPPAGETWARRMEREVKSLFLLARALGHGPRPVVLAATAMGGRFGVGEAPLPESFFPGHGGVAGLVKGLAHEWPEVLVRVVDLDPTEPAEQLADHLLAELADPSGPVEIGHADGTRLTLECVPAPLDGCESALPPLSENSTVLVTGGARGITAAVTLELAHRYRPNLVLVGRSTFPEGGEAMKTAGLTEPAELKAALTSRLRREGRPATPAAVEAAYQRLTQDREISANLTALQQTGARVHYYQADVRDEAAFGAVLDEVERRFGGIDGVLHGAGVIQDKLVQDKTPESYDRVFGTKVHSALILARRLRPERLKFCVFFASVAGRFGNRGQADYAAANEVLGKLAAHLDRRWPGRVVSVAWGPWSGIGMVSDLERHLSARGLQMIPPDVGPLFLAEELCLGRKGEPEVVIAGDVGQLALRRPEHVNVPAGGARRS